MHDCIPVANPGSRLAGATRLFQVREPGSRYGRYRNRAAHRHLTAARPEFPTVLNLRCGDGLPLEIGDRIGAATGERLDVIFPVAGTGAGCEPGGGARVRMLRRGRR